MKYHKKAIAVILVILIFVSAISPLPACAAEPEMRYGREKLGQMPNGANLQFVYDRLVAGCGNAEAAFQIDVSGRNIDINRDLSTIYTMFYSDYPEYFWINGAWNVSSLQKGSTMILTMKPTYTITGNALQSAKSAYNAKVAQLTAGLSGSDYDKAKTLHDRLIDTVTYTSTANDQNAYGALVEGKAVCNGYARAYQHLLMKAGIPAWYVKGTSTNPSANTPVGHAWNLVKIDGQWYYTDVTWDDQVENTFYTYFHITTQQLLQNHALDAQYANLVPKATATAANYYIKEGRAFDAYDQAKLVALLKKDYNKTQIYINGNLNSFISSVNANLNSIAANLGTTGSYSISYNITTLGKALILDIVILQKGHTHKVQQTISQVNPSCLSGGTKAYYICDCGLKFLDQGCTQQITNNAQLKIAASPHTPSGWKSDAASHWKECTQCGTETANTRDSHSDGNHDNKCDTCGYVLPEADTTGNTQNKEPAGNTQGTAPAGNTQGTEPADNSQGPQIPDRSDNTAPAADSSPAPAPTTADSQTDSKAGTGVPSRIVMGGAVIVVVSIGAAVALTSKKKQQ